MDVGNESVQLPLAECVNVPLLQTDTAQPRASRKFLCLVASFSICYSFKPITAYVIPYLVKYKGLTVFEVTNKLIPFYSYASLFFVILAAPACEYLSYWTVIQIGNFAAMTSMLILLFGKSLLMMQITEVVASCSVASLSVFQAYLFLLVSEKDFHLLTGLNQGSVSGSYVLAGELGQLLVLLGVSYDILTIISLIAGSITCAVGFFLPKYQAKADKKPLMLNFFSKTQGFVPVVKETWKDKHLQLLSILWAATYSGFILSLNYSTTLFQGINSDTKYNGHVVAAGTACAVLVSLCYVYLAKCVTKAGTRVYIVGNTVYGMLCVTMALSRSLWGAYVGYIILVAIEKLILCFLFAECGGLLGNNRYALLFSFNSGMGWVLAAIIQAIFEIAELDVFSEYIVLGGYFILIAILFTTAVVSCTCKTSTEESQSNAIHSTFQPLLDNHDTVAQ